MMRWALATAATAAAFGAAAAVECYPTCRFTFCPAVEDNAFTLTGQQDVPFTTAICDRTGAVVVGHVDQSLEAYVALPSGNVPISEWAPTGLLQPFAWSFFKSFGLNATEYGSDLSGVGHETPQQNQADFLDGTCFFMPLGTYQVLDGPGGHVIDNVHLNGDTRFTDCVAFSTYLPDAGAPPPTDASPPSPPDGTQPPQVFTTGAAPPMPETSVPRVFTNEAPDTDMPVMTEPMPEGTEPTDPAAPPAGTTAAPADTVPATDLPTGAPEMTDPVTEAPDMTEPVTDAPEMVDPATDAPEMTEPVTDAPEMTDPVTDAPEMTEPVTEAPEMTEPMTEAPETTMMVTEAPATTEAVTPAPMESLEEVTCTAGCPAESVLSPQYASCVAKLGDRSMSDYWVFASFNGADATGKSCGTASQEGTQLCTGTFQNAEWCNGGFMCGTEETYRPQIVQCVSAEGALCKLSAVQLEDIILEKIEDGTDFFISCAQ